MKAVRKNLVKATGGGVAGANFGKGERPTQAYCSPSSQAPKYKRGVLEFFATSAGAAKMPMPITRLTTIIERSKRLSFGVILMKF
ncbi:hypothetical protein ACRQ5D_19095 [Mucilaginibacter sp. P25]|uniref:hypothetical protein n=1 Tax=Mucilaginibacter sp. P25 TaxID=3423945 RepID=UPI003D7A50CE